MPGDCSESSVGANASQGTSKLGPAFFLNRRGSSPRRVKKSMNGEGDQRLFAS